MVYPKGEMPALERALLERPLFAMYEEKGMADSWETVLDTSSLSAVARAKPSPTLVDALRHIEATEGLAELAIKLRPNVTGTLSMFAGDTNVDVERSLVVFNVNDLVNQHGAHLQGVAYAMLMEHVRSRLLASRRGKLVAVDEAHIAFQHREMARFVSKTYRMAGKQGGRVVLMTQSVTDLVGDPKTGVQVEGEAEARVCLSNTGITFLLKNDKGVDLELIKGIYELTDAEIRFLRQTQPGQGLIIAGSDRVFVQVMASDTLHPLIDTRPSEAEVAEEFGGLEGEPGSAAEASVIEAR